MQRVLTLAFEQCKRHLNKNPSCFNPVFQVFSQSIRLEWVSYIGERIFSIYLGSLNSWLGVEILATSDLTGLILLHDQTIKIPTSIHPILHSVYKRELKFCGNTSIKWCIKETSRQRERKRHRKWVASRIEPSENHPSAPSSAQRHCQQWHLRRPPITLSHKIFPPDTHCLRSYEITIVPIPVISEVQSNQPSRITYIPSLVAYFPGEGTQWGDWCIYVASINHHRVPLLN